MSTRDAGEQRSLLRVISTILQMTRQEAADVEARIAELEKTMVSERSRWPKYHLVRSFASCPPTYSACTYPLCFAWRREAPPFVTVVKNPNGNAGLIQYVEHNRTHANRGTGYAQVFLKLPSTRGCERLHYMDACICAYVAQAMSLC